jgi:serine phosphatase RsbU (regulator of sigma subunit)
LEEIVIKRTAEISAQRDEILQKNTELQQQKEEILAQQEELSQKTADIETAYAEISEHSKNIQSSIAYAQRIQAVMLPRDNELARAFDDYFVLFKPRDVVSGDFYWFANYEERIIFAVFDCTGHGVPGAFMSMAGEAYLNMIINVQRCFSAGKILTELHNSITQSLKQNDSENRDGMDAAMCILNMKENTLEFAGAKNPLVTVREGEMTMYKSDSMSVGGRVKEGKKHEFSSVVIPLTPKTWYYMYSDGYQDQFGGTEKRKFMSQNFRELLRSISKEIGESQKQILEDSFRKWIQEGDETQIDDVTVVGFYFD